MHQQLSLLSLRVRAGSLLLKVRGPVGIPKNPGKNSKPSQSTGWHGGKWSESPSLKTRKGAGNSPQCHVRTDFCKTASEAPLPWKCQKCEALILQSREVQVYTLGKEDFLKAAQQLQNSGEKEEDNTFSCVVCGGRCTPRVTASRRNWGLAGGLSIHYPGECPWQQGEHSHSFPQDCAAATKRSVSTNKNSF